MDSEDEGADDETPHGNTTKNILLTVLHGYPDATLDVYIDHPNCSFIKRKNANSSKSQRVGMFSVGVKA